MKTAQTCAEMLLNNHELIDGEIVLDLPGLKISVRSNSEDLLEKLGTYFAHTLGSGPADIDIVAINTSPATFGMNFTDWKREPGKKGRKDAFIDLIDARVIHKVRTGMMFLQSLDFRIAHGPALKNDNQVINFINAQYMNYLQNEGMLICHASALVKNGRALGIAGFSGGGKSTLMLHLLGEKGVSYLTNDRLFIKDSHATGIPKLPRVNPGTILNDTNLVSILDEDQRHRLNKLQSDDLWDLEEKYDVFVEEVYGEGKISNQAPLDSFLLLNWKRNSHEPFSIHEINLEQRPDLLPTIMKSPGPFYLSGEGTFLSDTPGFNEKRYLDELNKVTIYEARGCIDFHLAKNFCMDQILT